MALDASFVDTLARLHFMLIKDRVNEL